MEPEQLHEEVWIMKAKHNQFDIIISSSYDLCFIQAKKQIKNHFKIIKS